MAVAAEAPLCGDHSEASVEALPPVVEPLPLDDEAVTGGTCGKGRGVSYIRPDEIWMVTGEVLCCQNVTSVEKAHVHLF